MIKKIIFPTVQKKIVYLPLDYYRIQSTNIQNNNYLKY